MSSRVELSDMETTRAEKFLAFVLAVFLLIGGLWTYFQPLDRGSGEAFLEQRAGSPRDHASVDRLEEARAERRQAQRAAGAARDRLEVAREDYRTTLDAGRPDPAREARFERARRVLEAAEDRLGRARGRERELAPAGRAAQRRVEAAEDRALRKLEDEEDARARETFFLRLDWVVGTLALAFWFFNRRRRRHSRYLAIGMAAVGAATAQGLVMAGDYTTDYIEVTEVGPLVLSVIGVVFSLLAFVGLQRYLARRLPQRRVRRRECPFCGFPVADNPRSEGCGREGGAECSTCSAPRRVGTAHCGACGSP